tara:strand:- start:97 stop:336 length:240 start_codon:yes stop_codon:yes gene_type:complete
MENNKLTKDFLKQLTRIADALDKQNVIEEKKIKESKKLEKLQEKIAGLELKTIQEKRKVGEINHILSNEMDKNNTDESV